MALTRRLALSAVAGLLAHRPLPGQGGCTAPEMLVLDLGAGACSTRVIRVRLGALVADVAVSELLVALGARAANE